MSDYIKKVTCVTDNFKDGQKIVAARIQYNFEIDKSWISAPCFWVKDRKIIGIDVDGCEVTLQLDPSQREAGIVKPPSPPINLEEAPRITPKKLPEGVPSRDRPPAVCKPRKVIVRQVSEIKALDGTIIKPAEKDYISDEAVEPIICEFKQFEYGGIPYNLFEPEKNEEKLPLVVFIHDAGTCGDDPQITLSQGSGAISFAAPEWQKEHPCFVLAPQISRGIHLTKDNFEVADELEVIKALIDDVADKYNVDKRRIYCTGQSMGCMAFCEMNIRYPEYFAASLLVAGQWSPEKMADKCTKCKFWILVSEHDARAFPGMNAVADALEEKGVVIGRYFWDGKLSDEEINILVGKAMRDDVDMRYTVFNGSTVVPPGTVDGPGSNHTSTWNRVYPIKGLKEWLFSCKK
ncbi:MAG: hypothetical protein ACOX75_02505 [Lachnospiraceae bacterium]|jgi:predicted peptidase